MDSFRIEELREILLKYSPKTSTLEFTKHNIGKAKELIPFTPQVISAIDGNFSNVLGSFARNMLGKDVNLKQIKQVNEVEAFEDNFEELSIYIASKSSDEMNFDVKNDFMKVINAFLYKNKKLQPIHPFLFSFMNYGESNFNRYGQFLSDVFGKQTNLPKIFNDKSAEHLLNSIIINNISELLVEKKIESTPFQNLLPFLSDYYKKDIEFLQNDSEKFLVDFNLLTHFYTTMYISQIIYKFEMYDKADYNTATPFFFVLDWEAVSKRRESSSSILGFKTVMERSKKFFAHSHTLAQLSHNSFQNENIYTIKTYSELKEILELENEEYQKDFIEKVRVWLKQYQEIKKISNENEMPSDYSSLIKYYCNTLNKGMSQSVQMKYATGIKHLASTEFVKARGSLGSMFNMKHDLLILLTSVIIQEERMPLKVVFEEFKNRGIQFDKYSRQAVIELFKSYNMLDNKSDSGDAQYVKRIL